eukprot:TRINITY_DN16691_c0_g1_i1.p1 TRINITY_DN16691_c0_g1~~TRINITY_DN16691_c0_g1_i1.p1  ORF type:complete len:604 (+),score=83.47 TRINITY_DN16691_c0_g1_i1:61-1872(+)
MLGGMARISAAVAAACLVTSSLPQATQASASCPAGRSARGSSMLQAGKGPPRFFGNTVSCESSEVSCERGDIFGSSQFCVPRNQGCPVACEDGEHECHTPPTCPTCPGVNYCSSQPCAMICGQDELLCDVKAMSTQVCAKQADGCPADCASDQYTCHSPPSCAGCLGRNWCSPSPCPKLCETSQVLCGDTCRSKLEGCPANCSKEEYLCHSPPLVEGAEARNFCSKSPCPAKCNATEAACAGADGSEFCVPMAEGCPVSCSMGEHVCRMPPSCENCTATNWCSTSPCPSTCNHANEILCKEHGNASCVPKDEGCPVTCAGEGEDRRRRRKSLDDSGSGKAEKVYKCHMPPQREGDAGLNWCSTVPCPEICNAGEVPCSSSSGGGNYCMPKAAGCPVKCSAKQNQCHTPARTAGDVAVNWCSEAACPISCSEQEVACETNNASQCVLKMVGCPAKCSAGENTCHLPPTCAGCTAVNFCSKDACPVECSLSEVVCPSEDGRGRCVPKNQGCPANCTKNENECHLPPSCDGCVGYNYCSATPCPAKCDLTETTCTKVDGSEFCVPLSHGCPVMCDKDQYMCHTPPECQECVGTNWCSAAPCPAPSV